MRLAGRAGVGVCAVLFGVALCLGFLSGCSEETDRGVGPRKTPDLLIDDVILNPKSPAPGDTLLVTAVVDIDSDHDGYPDYRDRCPNEPEDSKGAADGCPEKVGGADESASGATFLAYEWSATGGAFLETNLSTVRWVAPDTSTVFVVTVRVSDGSKSKSASREVFVSRISPVIASRAGQMRLSSTGDSLFYFSSLAPPGQSGFTGFGVRMFARGLDRELMAANNSSQLQLNRQLSKVAYTVPGGFGLIRVHYTDLITRATTIVPAAPLLGRLPQYTEPDFSPDDSLLTYQVWLPDWMQAPIQGGVDTFIVAVWDLRTRTEKRVAVGGTATGARGTNFHPTFSNDGRHLVYMADPVGRLQWELYALPVSGRSVAVDTTTPPIQLTFSGGLMGKTHPPVNRRKLWSPNTAVPVLATVDANDKLRLVPTNGTGDVLVNVPGLAREFVWMASGQALLMTTGTEIYRVTVAGQPTLVHRAAKGDNVTRVSSSSDGNLLLYAVTRLSDVWYEIIDLSGSFGLAGPIRVTPSSRPGEAPTYSTFGSNASVWSPSQPKAFMLFFDAGPTPRVCTMSFGGLTP